MRTVTAASCQKGCFLRHRNELPAAGIRVARCCGGPRNFVRGIDFISQNKFHSRDKLFGVPLRTARVCVLPRGSVLRRKARRAQIRTNSLLQFCLAA